MAWKRELGKYTILAFLLNDNPITLKSSLVEINKTSFNTLSKHVENIADVEKLDAHKLSVTIRQTK